MGDIILPVELWYRIKHYSTMVDKIANVSKDFREIFMEDHFINRNDHLNNFVKSFVPTFEVSPLVDRLISDLKKQIDSKLFFYYCDLFLLNRNKILTCFKVLYPHETKYDDYRFEPADDFFDKIVFALTKFESSNEYDLLTVFDCNHFDDTYYQKRLGRTNVEVVNFSGWTISDILKNKSNFNQLSNQHFFPQTNDVINKVLQFIEMKKFKGSRFFILPETYDDLQKLYYHKQLIQHPVDIVFPLSPFDWQTFVDLKTQLMNMFLNPATISSFLLCHHTPNLLLLNIKWNKNHLLPYRLLNTYPWKRIQENIQTLFNFDADCFKLGAQFAYPLLSVQPESLKARSKFMSDSPLSLVKKLVLMNLSVEKLTFTIVKQPKAMISSQNLQTFIFYVHKLNEAPLELLEKINLENYPSRSYYRERLNFLYYSRRFEASDFLQRHEFMKMNSFHFDVRSCGTEFYQRHNLNDYRIVFDKFNFPTCEDLVTKSNFLKSCFPSFQYYNDLYRSCYCYIPNNILMEVVKWSKNLPTKSKLKITHFTDLFSQFNQEEILTAWNIIKGLPENLLSFVKNFVFSYQELLNFSENRDVVQKLQSSVYHSKYSTKQNLQMVLDFIEQFYPKSLKLILINFNIDQLRTLSQFKDVLNQFSYLKYLQHLSLDEIEKVMNMFVNNEIK